MSAPVSQALLRQGIARFPRIISAWSTQKLHPNSFLNTRQLTVSRIAFDSQDDSRKNKPAIKKKLNLAKPGKKAASKPPPAVGSSADDSSSSDDSSSDEGSSSSDEEIDKDVKESVSAVAQAFKGNKRKIKTDLMHKLKDEAKLSKAQKDGKPPPRTFSSIIARLKVESREAAQAKSRPPRPQRQSSERQPQRREGQRGLRTKETVLDTFKLFQSPPLGIFSPTKSEPENVPENSMFDSIEQEQVQQKMTFPPENSFEEMVRWTEEGKLWTFPVNNEQGMEEEALVGFHEHVFLEHLLTDFPRQGPVRHFMELVITGLSKNPYITVAQKHEHVEWYKEYFIDKYELIEELTVSAEQQKI